MKKEAYRYKCFLLGIWLFLSGSTVWADVSLMAQVAPSQALPAAMMRLEVQSTSTAQQARNPIQRMIRKVAAKNISPEQAIAQAKQVSPGRVLSVNKVQQGGKSVFRIKILGANGRVSWVTIDASTGAVVGN